MFLKSVNECGIPDLSDSFFTESFEDHPVGSVKVLQRNDRDSF
jgi:hypothetical protein